MRIQLAELSVDEVRGIYKGKLPVRMRYLHPAARSGFREIAAQVVVSDMFRSAESSLQAIKEKRGAQPPGWSGHGYGFSIDLDVGKTLKLAEIKNKEALDHYMAEHGWICHRLDHKRLREEWHYNYLVVVNPGEKYSSTALERKIQAIYGSQLVLNPKEVQAALAMVGMYSGEIDGKLGPLTAAGVTAFQRAWGLKADGVAGRNTQRTLAYVTAEHSW